MSWIEVVCSVMRGGATPVSIPLRVLSVGVRAGAKAAFDELLLASKEVAEPAADTKMAGIPYTYSKRAGGAAAVFSLMASSFLAGLYGPAAVQNGAQMIQQTAHEFAPTVIAAPTTPASDKKPAP